MRMRKSVQTALLATATSQADHTSPHHHAPDASGTLLDEFLKMNERMEKRMSDFEGRIDTLKQDYAYDDEQNFIYEDDDDDYIPPSQAHIAKIYETGTVDLATELLSGEEVVHAHDEISADPSGLEVVNLIRETLPITTTDGAPIDTKLAELVHQVFTTKFDDAVIEQKLKDLKKPANCLDLNTPEINKLIWDSLQSDTRSMDVKMQRVQSGMIKSTIAVTNTLNSLIAHKQEVPATLFRDIVSKLSDSLTMSAYVNRELNLRRKELIKPQLNDHYRALCTPSAPTSSDYLFREDVAKHLKDIAMSTRLGHKATSYGHGRGRGWHRYQPYPYGGNRWARVRGRERYYHGTPFLGNGRGCWNKFSEKRGGGKSAKQ
ncbi:uncharacterized protein LOC124124828 [Haliotis rufescens]|uniref:uncharacterized protein LOC124124828 n=1 Tax=Haliotis rufescens TaxID=6454 RepID=UPI00201EAAD3|nr:uncharacterized protein LOC124124828 [Haliotis rufescens]